MPPKAKSQPAKQPNKSVKNEEEPKKNANKPNNPQQKKDNTPQQKKDNAPQQKTNNPQQKKDNPQQKKDNPQQQKNNNPQQKKNNKEPEPKKGANPPKKQNKKNKNDDFFSTLDNMEDLLEKEIQQYEQEQMQIEDAANQQEEKDLTFDDFEFNTEKPRKKKKAAKNPQPAPETNKIEKIETNFDSDERPEDFSLVDQANLDDFAFTEASLKVDDNANDIKVERFSIAAAGKELFTNATLVLTPGRRYGLVGPNGMGKTTLLNHVAQRKLRLPASIDVFMCEQEIVIENENITALQMVVKADRTRILLLDSERKLLDELSNTEPDKQQEILDELEKIADQLKSMSAEAAESTARRILAGLGFTKTMQNSPVESFSGGWRMRISLARALFMQPSLLLLDEPTNHLDLNAVIWLESYLATYKKMLLIVSHDQHFLDAICTDIIHLENKKLHYYRGNYEMFKKMHEKRMREMEKAYERQVKQLKQLKLSGKSTKNAEKQVAATQKRKQEKISGGKKSKNNDDDDDMNTAGTNKKPELLERPREYRVRFRIPQSNSQLGPPFLGVKNMCFKYESVRGNNKNEYLFENVDFGIDLSSRVAIVGPNGVGKSTFLKILMGQLTLTEGELVRNPRCRISYFSQHSGEQLELNLTPVEYLQKKYNKQMQDCRKMLGDFGLPSHAHTIQMNKLSGGQKARVALVDLSCQNPDIIILDEPTNNLDLESIDALAEALSNFDGGVIIVSHDARLIVESNCVLWIIEDKNVCVVDGDFDDYRKEVLEQVENE